MLLFIWQEEIEKRIQYKFQYISCCYLSVARYSIVSATSFVSIHLMLLFIELLCSNLKIEATFQYISCCYLSKEAYNTLLIFQKFQYISCCYLSYYVSLLFPLTAVSIHLMLLFIDVCKASKEKGDYVSIHLMLLFIVINKSLNIIRCYRFNTSHVVIYRFFFC